MKKTTVVIHVDAIDFIFHYYDFKTNERKKGKIAMCTCLCAKYTIYTKKCTLKITTYLLCYLIAIRSMLRAALLLARLKKKHMKTLKARVCVCVRELGAHSVKFIKSFSDQRNSLVLKTRFIFLCCCCCCWCCRVFYIRCCWFYCSCSYSYLCLVCSNVYMCMCMYKCETIFAGMSPQKYNINLLDIVATASFLY